jgi:capsular exopolysaccharide synthesis family protein
MPNALDLLKALRHRWPLALALGLVCGGLAAGAAWVALGAPEYSAYALLQVAETQPKIIFKTDETRADFDTYQKTQLALLKSRPVLNVALRDEKVAKLKLDQRHADPLVWLEKKIQASYSGELLRISMSGPEPSELAILINAVTLAYLEEIVNKDKTERRARHETLKRLYTDFQGRLEAKRKELKTLAQQLGSSDRETVQFAQELALERREIAKLELLDLDRELQELRIQAAVRRESMARGNAASGKSAAPVDAMIAEDEVIRQYDAEIARWQERLQQHRQLVRSPSDPAIRNAQQAITQLQAGRKDRESSLRAQLGRRPRGRENLGAGSGDLVAMEERIRVLEELRHLIAKEVESTEAKTQQMTQDTWMLEQVRDELEQIDAAATKVGAEVEALNVELEAPDRVVWSEHAQDPRLQEDKRPKMAGMAGVGAFGLALLGVALLEYRARRIHSVNAIVGELQLRLVGALPALPARRGSASIANASAEARWKSTLLESVDAMRTLLLRASTIDDIRSVMITSAVAEEGKTSLASHLATSLARSGRRTLLVDCDLRKPDVHRLFDVVPQPGLSELLRGEVDLDAAIHPSPAADLWILPAGSADDRAIQALAQAGARAIFERFRGRYDFVVVDTAPVLPVADALLVGQYVDGAIYSVLRSASRIPRVNAAADRLRSVGVRILGAVMTGVQGDTYGSQYSYAYTYPGPAASSTAE